MRIFIQGFILIFLFAISVPIAIWGWSKIDELSTQTVKSYKNKIIPEPSFYFKQLDIEIKNEDSLKNIIDSTNTDKTPLDKEKNYMYDNVPFNAENDLLEYVLIKNSAYERIIKYFRSYYDVNTSHGKIAVTMTTAFIFALIGGITGVSYKLTKGVIVETNSFIFEPLFAGMMGFIVLGFSEFIPIVFQNNPELNVVRPSTLFFLCFFCGLSAEKIFESARDFIINTFRELTMGRQKYE